MCVSAAVAALKRQQTLVCHIGMYTLQLGIIDGHHWLIRGEPTPRAPPNEMHWLGAGGVLASALSVPPLRVSL